ncbi:hypothetical protein [Moritella sp. JT01]|uniref:hypothetical protein n=1 Tax=Moritella sp. JT01 TaxID=756698 RepID=UPI00082D92FB|nr:hypothetical protein [Moritella sp. JT01]
MSKNIILCLDGTWNKPGEGGHTESEETFTGKSTFDLYLGGMIGTYHSLICNGNSLYGSEYHHL